MDTAADTRSRPQPVAAPVNARRWLMLVHQLPASPSNLRVRTWRRLQGLGAIGVKQSVYVLPDSASAREDFEWLKVEIEAAGGEASVFAADPVDQGVDAELVDAFRRARQMDYAEVAADLQRLQRPGKSARAPQPNPRRDQLTRFRQRVAAIERIDFFGSAGRDRVMALLALLEDRSGDTFSGPGDEPSDRYRNRVWMTRPLPGVDRMSSAWLIRRFIDPAARFAFAVDPKAAGPDAVTFDMFGGTFTHEGERCTFETLCARFAIDDPAVRRLAQLVHDVDLKDHRFGAPEAETVEATIEGLRLSCAEDVALLEQGIVLFEALYRAFAQSSAPPRPRPVSRKPRSGKSK
jgi:hypothetical protein